ncbi:MAG: hypothetical protein HOL22_04370 [Euryarchaeota archaeon]|jgi:hypothetical protein|nr:hypothetical protein [Euryarchaeota archaeon]MBT5594214.1 hypothetical protein [Euryarchaeota archaeon]MBT5844923.1 hypothetical protein [Euryarchaeota archaeon]MBT6640519.1 hypothetical protein [Euryarchaeota archaeon]MBT6845702.1 hypothetical protein [Euryarchaeota archaeon]
MVEPKLQQALANPVVRSFIAFSIFRAFYGAGILLVTYFLSTSAEAPWPVSVGFLLFSMIFSRWLFKRIKGRNNLTDDLD